MSAGGASPSTPSKLTEVDLEQLRFKWKQQVKLIEVQDSDYCLNYF